MKYRHVLYYAKIYFRHVQREFVYSDIDTVLILLYTRARACVIKYIII